MAVAFIFETDTMAQDEYDGLMEAMGLSEPGAITAGPVGVLAHIAGPKVDGGWRVIDVWESEEAANAFYTSDQFGAVRGSPGAADLRTTPWPVHRLEISKI